MRKVAITGHTSGIGRALYERLGRNPVYEVTGFSRINDFDLSKPGTIGRIIERVHDCNVMINNAFDDWAQIDLLYALFEEWKHEPKTIINIGSNSGDTVKAFAHKYASVKSALDVACTQLNNLGDAQCRVVNVRPGWVRTPRVESLHVQSPMLATDDVADVIDWILSLPPGVHVSALTVTAR